MSVRLEVWGDYACFTRPEMKVERVSYDVMTPSAARGILEAIFWHPGMKYVIDRIHVLSPIAFANIRRNEVKSKVSASAVYEHMTGGGKDLYLNTSEDIQQRAAMVLQNVRYVIDAHFELVPDKMGAGDNVGKFSEMLKRRIEKGQCYHRPYFGCREFPVQFQMWEEKDIPAAYPNETRDLGFMLFDMDYRDPQNIRPMFFRATLENGVLDLRNVEVLQ
ncbi:MAG: type I-C CRISPR-associated protein Cas5 [Mogibacterium sp.]|nr:type I-C CRISPR-associated protein Cas5 [Mogibacterium sp.]MBR3136115.1 type I-C CRISPR-associated protein Cas5 [Clostridia bacterium]